MGVAGVAGEFTALMVATTDVMRANHGQLMPTIEAFVHDFTSAESAAGEQSRAGSEGEKRIINARAAREVRGRLMGLVGVGGSAVSVETQVESVINECTDDERLCKMFVGWAPWL